MKDNLTRANTFLTSPRRFSKRVTEKVRQLGAPEKRLLEVPGFLRRDDSSEGSPANIEKILDTLVAFPTVTDDLGANHIALSYIARYLQKRGMYVERFEPTAKHYEVLLASTRKNNAKNPLVLLCAHIDVVHADEELFIMRKTDDKYLGRGVYDMKCAISSYMKVVDELQDCLQEYDFAILLTSDEEISGRDGVSGVREMVAAGTLPQVVVLPDGGRDWQLESSANGYMHYRLEAHGKSGHGSRPWEGENAIMKLSAALHGLREHFGENGPDADTINIGAIEGGEVANKIPSYARAEVSMRLHHTSSRKRLEALVEGLCQKHDIVATLRTAWEPTFNDLNNHFIRDFSACVQEITDIKVTGIRSLGGSDARFFQEAGVPCVVFYPLGGGHHSAEEWLDARSLEQLPQILRLYLDRIAKR